ncbi:MAG: hypothetical protein HUJ61_05800, partial [Bacilli bacterium]|nr:hypothetical protein [Bacilli bacterium]
MLLNNGICRFKDLHTIELIIDAKDFILNDFKVIDLNGNDSFIGQSSFESNGG